MGRVISTCIQFIDAFSNPSNKTIANMRKMAMEAKRAGRSIQGAGNTIQNAGKSLTKAVTAPIAGVGVAAVKTAADFESAMSEVGAISGNVADKDLPKIMKKAKAMGLSFKEGASATETASNILKAKAKEMGATTSFSASESAEAMKYMAMAGWKTTDMMEGVAGVMNLAAASGEDLGSTSDIVTDALTAFGMKANESSRFADVLATTSSSANTNVSMMGESFKYCASTAGAMGYSVEDISVALGVLGNAGIKGSMAGTTLKNVIANLAKPTDAQAAVMKKLGISLTDSHGKTKDFSEVMKNLRSSFAGLSETQKASAASTLAGKQSMAGLLTIVNTGQKDFDKLTGAINSSKGSAEAMAGKMLDNLNGQLTLLKSALEGAAITIGDKLTPYIKIAVGWVQKATDWFNSLSDAQVSQIMKWAGIAAAVGPCILMFGKLVTGVGKVVTGFGKVTSAITNAGSVIGLLTSPAGIVIGVLAAIAVAAVLVAKNWDKIKPVVMNVKAWFTETFGGAIKQAMTGFQKIFASVMQGIKTILPGVMASIKTAIQAAMPVVRSIASAIKVMLPAAIETIKTVIQAAMPVIQTAVQVVSKLLPKAIEMAKTAIHSIAPTIKTVIAVVAEVVPIIATTFVGVLEKLSPVIKTIGTAAKKHLIVMGNLLSHAFSFLGSTIAKLSPSINKIAKVVGGVLVYAVRKVSPVVVKMAAAFSAAFTGIYNISSNIVNKLKPVYTAIGTVIKVVMGVVQKRFVSTFQTVASVVSSTSSSVKQVIRGLTKAFGGVLDFITGVFSGNWKKAWEGVKNIFGGIFDGLAGMCKVPINAVIGLINKAIGGINKISIDIPEGVPGIGGKHIGGFNIPTIPALAKGTQDWRGGIVQVGEKGGEIVDLPKGSRVYPHDQSVQMARKSADGKLAAADRKAARLEKSAADRKRAGDITVNIPKLAEQIIVRDEKDIERIAEEIARKLRDTAINMGTV